MRAKPVVSVICPAHNRSAPICATIRSVQAQRMPDWELIVVLDGCTDDTEVWVNGFAQEDPRITVIRTPGFGHPGPARAAALAQATGEVIAYLDHDDLWLPQHLEVVLRLVESGAELVATGHRTIDDQGRPLRGSEGVELCWDPELQLLSPMFQPSRVAHLTGLAEEVGGWRAGIGLEDWDLWVRLTDAGYRFRTTATRTAVLREHPDSRRFSTTRRHRMPLSEFVDVRTARAALDDLHGADLLLEMSEAAAVDAGRWFGDMLQAGTLVVPDDWDVAGQDLPAEFAAAARRSAQRWTDDLVLLQSGGRFVLSLLLWCATSELAQRVEVLSRRVLVRQLQMLARVARSHGGTPIAGRVGLVGSKARVGA